MDHFDFHMYVANGLQLYGQAGSPKPIRGRWSAWYTAWATTAVAMATWQRRWPPQAMRCSAFDLRGHGKSDGPRRPHAEFDVLLDDIGNMLDEATGLYPGQPRFLYGHSLGGNLVLNYALRRRPAIAGVISTGPWLRLAFEPPAMKLCLARLMERVWPAFRQSNGLDTRALSHDPQVIRYNMRSVGT